MTQYIQHAMTFWGAKLNGQTVFLFTDANQGHKESINIITRENKLKAIEHTHSHMHIHTRNNCTSEKVQK